MVNIIVEASKYLIIIFFAVYAYQCFSVFSSKKNDEDKAAIFSGQNRLMFFIHFIANVDILIKSENKEIIVFYVWQVLLLASILILYRFLYPKASRLVVNNMCMLLVISFIMLSRLSLDKAQKQFFIAVISMVITLLIPFFIHKITYLKKLTWIYGIGGILLLAAVAVAGRVSYGAKLSFSIGGISLQPSEFVKIMFVFFISSMLCQSTELRHLIKTTIIAAFHVLLLVVSKDLGGALIFFIVYLVMLYVATKKPLYALGGLLSGSFAAILAYFLFSHVRVRVLAWKDPWAVMKGEGYQITQSLFAIGTGGWFGLGLYQGLPKKIPVVEQDFIFSAISEELGGIFALCLILVCVSCFIMFLNIALQMKEQFYKLIALGLGTVYGFQVFLTIGGVTKFIPSTGVTLPLVSYGGSSLFSTLIIFAIIQGLYILRQDEGESNDRSKKEKQKVKRTKRKIEKARKE